MPHVRTGRPWNDQLGREWDEKTIENIDLLMDQLEKFQPQVSDSGKSDSEAVAQILGFLHEPFLCDDIHFDLLVIDPTKAKLFVEFYNTNLR